MNQVLEDRSHCKNVTEILEKNIRYTLYSLYSSKAQESSFTFPFMKGCGKEVYDMIKTYHLDPMIKPSETLNTVNSLIISFNLEENKSFILLTK